MKRTLAIILVLSLALCLTGCTDMQVRNALVDMGYAPANPDQSPAPTPDATATPAPTPTIAPTPKPDNVNAVDDIIEVDGYPKSVRLNKKKLTLAVGQSQKLKATVKPKKAKLKELTWTSSEETVATVNGKGKITALSPGSAVITCETANGLKAECEVTVKQKKGNAD